MAKQAPQHRNPPALSLQEQHRLRARELEVLTREILKQRSGALEFRPGELWRCQNGSLVLIMNKTHDGDGDWMSHAVVLRTTTTEEYDDENDNTQTRSANYSDHFYHDNGHCTDAGSGWNLLTRVAADFQSFFSGAAL